MAVDPARRNPRGLETSVNGTATHQFEWQGSGYRLAVPRPSSLLAVIRNGRVISGHQNSLLTPKRFASCRTEASD